MVAVLAAWLAISGGIGAGVPRAVAVVSIVCDDEPFLATVQGRLASTLANAGYQVELDPTPGVAGSRRCGATARHDARQALEDARKLFEEGLRHDAAQLKLDEGLTVLTEAGIHTDSDLRALLLFYSGWIWLELGDQERAEAQMRRALSASANFRPEAGRFPPHVTEAFERARARPARGTASPFGGPSSPRALLERAVFEGTDETLQATLTRSGEVTVVLAPAASGIVHARIVRAGPPPQVEPLVFTGATLAADLESAASIIGAPSTRIGSPGLDQASSISAPQVAKALLLGGIGGAAIWSLVLVYRDHFAD